MLSIVPECGEDGGWKMGFPQPSQKVEMLLGFLGNEASVEGPGDVLCQLDTKEFGALDYLHGGDIRGRPWLRR